MNKNQTETTNPNARLIIILAVATTLLLVPFIAMFFTSEVNWSSFDFVVAGVLLYGTGLLLELILRKVKSTKSRIVAAVILFVVLFLVWAELAVGIFGTPFAGS
jgi:hypothetical protein